jgi:hypothetical protein
MTKRLAIVLACLCVLLNLLIYWRSRAGTWLKMGTSLGPPDYIWVRVEDGAMRPCDETFTDMLKQCFRVK